jgi:hypothetical protein
VLDKGSSEDLGGEPGRVQQRFARITISFAVQLIEMIDDSGT